MRPHMAPGLESAKGRARSLQRKPFRYEACLRAAVNSRPAAAMPCDEGDAGESRGQESVG